LLAAVRLSNSSAPLDKWIWSIIEREFGDFPLSALTERAARGMFRNGVTNLRNVPAGKPTTRG